MGKVHRKSVHIFSSLCWTVGPCWLSVLYYSLFLVRFFVVNNLSWSFFMLVRKEHADTFLQLHNLPLCEPIGVYLTNSY